MVEIIRSESKTWAMSSFTFSSSFFSSFFDFPFTLSRLCVYFFAVDRCKQQNFRIFFILSFFCCYKKWNIKRCISKSTSIVIPAIFIRSTFFFLLLLFRYFSFSQHPFFRIYHSIYFFSDELFEHVTDPKVSITQKHLFVVFNRRWRRK